MVIHFSGIVLCMALRPDNNFKVQFIPYEETYQHLGPIFVIKRNRLLKKKIPVSPSTAQTESPLTSC